MLVALGTPINAIPKPWLYYRVSAIMVSAYDLMRGPRVVRSGDAPLQSLLCFSGDVYVDSGGYQLLRRGVQIDLDNLVKVYNRWWDAKYYLSLDYPPHPADDEQTVRRKLKKTFENFLRLRCVFKDSVMPVIHFHHRVDVVWEFLRKYLDYSPDVIAVGALVPYVLTLRGVPRNSRRLAMRFLLDLRAEVRHKIHVLGLGSPVITPILKLIGIDSTDSSTWRIKAAYGKILLPGGGERHVSSRSIKFGKKRATPEDIELVRMFLKEKGFPLLNEFNRIYTDFEYRALVNAYIVLHSDVEPRSRQFLKIFNELHQIKNDRARGVEICGWSR